MIIGALPSPASGVWWLGPIAIHGYALCILAGILAGIWLGNRRLVAVGGQQGLIADIAVWAVPAGVVGARLYHVATDWYTYFGPGGRGLLATIRIWDGGLGIWGGVAAGFAAAYWYCRKHGHSISQVADAVAPGILLAQAIGRWGNWFNQELFGAPSDLPWALQIDPAHRPAGYEHFSTFHPTFLYESLWNLAMIYVLLWLERRWSLRNGSVFAMYIVLYCCGRAWVEMLRIDTANHILGLRINVFTAVLTGLTAAVWLWRRQRNAPPAA